jgi:hypothetical protein
VARARAKPKPKPKRAPAKKPAARRKPRASKPARQVAYKLVPIHEDDTGFARGSQVLPVLSFEAVKPVAEPGRFGGAGRPAPWSTRVETPFAERAGGAGKCAHCAGKIKRAGWQVVVTDDGATIHPGCAFAWTHEHLEDGAAADDWMAALVEHLSEADRAELLSQLTPR